MTKLNWNKAKRYKEYIPLKPDYRNSIPSHYSEHNFTRAYSGRAHALGEQDGHTKANRKRYRELVDRGIESICATQDEIDRHLLRGAYGKQALLESIYTVLWDGGMAGM